MNRLWLARVLGAPLSGLALAFAFPPGSATIDAWVSIAWLTVVSLGVRPRQAALFGWLHGAVFYGVTLPWIYTVMRVHGGLGVAAAAGVMGLVVAAAALFPAAFAWGVAWVGGSSVTRACFAVPFLWVALEYARTHLPHLGFPWNLLGYAASGNSALLQVVSLTGIYGLSFLVAGYNALLAWAFLHYASARRRTPLLVWLSVTAVLVAYAGLGARLLPIERAQYAARLVQTNFPQAPSYPVDWMERHAAELDQLERLSSPAGGQAPGLVIWPEVPAPFSLEDAKFAGWAERIARASRGDFLVGVVDWKSTAQGGLAAYNSAALLDASGREIFLYDKIHLVPFGEYVPLRRWLTFAGKLTAEVGDFQSGSAYKVGKLAGGRQFGAFICYEAVFPDVVRRFTLNGAELLINLSNDGWFGRSAAPEQHLAMARVRAVENRRWLLRVTNNGYTAVVDPYGRYRARMAPDVRDAMTVAYGFRDDLTPYVRWGDWLAWLCVVVTAGLVVRRPARRPRG
jgi:apolipoprotein N-acyltransferase